MDDLNEKLNRLLSSPEGMAKIQSAMAALSGGQETPTPAPAQPVQPAPPRDGGGLPDMAALTAVHPAYLTDLQHGLYPVTGQRHRMTAGAVERSLRLCVEATWSRGALEDLERFFGSSVDPDRGKPTNREFLCRVQERITLGASRLRH